MADTVNRPRITRACAALLIAAVTTACDTTAPWEPSLPPEAGFRVDNGILKLWTGIPCEGVTGLTLIFDTGTSQSTTQVWTTPKPGVRVEHLDLLTTTGEPLPDTGGLQIETPLPAGYDWTKAEKINVYVNGPRANGARTDVAQVLRESAGHPPESYLFWRSGWMNTSDVQRENRKSFLTMCTPDPE